MPFLCFYRSLIEQLRKLQAMVKMSTMKASATSTCVMVLLLFFSTCPKCRLVPTHSAARLCSALTLLSSRPQVFLLSFCLIIFPAVSPFGRKTEQKELYTPSSGKLMLWWGCGSFLRALKLRFRAPATLLQSSPGPSARCHQRAPTPCLTWRPKTRTSSWCRKQSWRTSNPSLPAARITTPLTTRGWSGPSPRAESTATLRPTSPLRPRLRRCPQVQSGPDWGRRLSMLRWLLRWHTM